MIAFNQQKHDFPDKAVIDHTPGQLDSIDIREKCTTCPSGTEQSTKEKKTYDLPASDYRPDCLDHNNV